MQIFINLSKAKELVSSSEVRPKSSYVKTFGRKKAQRDGSPIPIDNTQFGNVSLSWLLESNDTGSGTNKLYRLTYKSKLSNSVTTLNRLGSSRYMVTRSSPKLAEPMSYMFEDKEPAIQAFLCNLDIYRIPDDFVKQAREWCTDHIKRAENLKSIYFNPKKTRSAQSNFNRTILIGPKKQHQGMLIGVDFSGKKIKVRIEDPTTKKLGPERTISAEHAWFE